MAEYDRQLVVVLLDGGPRDAEWGAAADDLGAKAAGRGLASARVDVSVDGGSGVLAVELGRLSPQSRVYLLGAGRWPDAAVGGRGPEDVADLLAGGGLPAVRVISVVADEAGREPGWEPGSALGGPGGSFAARFHRRLAGHGLRVPVLARVYPVAVVGPEGGPDRGRKQTAAAGAWAGKRAESKVRLDWAGDTQVQEWVDYGG